MAKLDMCWRQSVTGSTLNSNRETNCKQFIFLSFFDYFFGAKPFINFFFLTLVSTAALKNCYLFRNRDLESISYCIPDWSCSWRWMFKMSISKNKHFDVNMDCSCLFSFKFSSYNRFLKLLYKVDPGKSFTFQEQDVTIYSMWISSCSM